MTKKAIIIAPSSFWPTKSKDKKDIAVFFQKNGYSVTWSKSAQKDEKIIGSKDKEKAIELNNAFKQKQDVILALRGGYGSARLLPLLDWKNIKKSKSLFVGFSDSTVFQNAYYARAKKPSISGMLARFLMNKPDKTLTHSFTNCLLGGGIEFHGLPSFAKGRARGILIGGNLTCFTTLLGTPYLPSLKGKILLLEEVGEAPYRIDRMLVHLQNAGIFNKVRGVVLGSFYNCRNKNETCDKEVYNVLTRFFKGFKIPVIYGCPYGHEPQHFCLPFGTKTTIDTEKQILRIDGISKKS